jgi:hypothetical protein
MQHIEDVRPLVAAFHWAYYEANRIHGGYSDASKQADIAGALNATVRTLASDFRSLDYFKAWRKRHHRLLHLDSAAELDLLLDALTAVNIETVGTIAHLFERFTGRASHATRAAMELRSTIFGRSERRDFALSSMAILMIRFRSRSTPALRRT